MANAIYGRIDDANAGICSQFTDFSASLLCFCLPLPSTQRYAPLQSSFRIYCYAPLQRRASFSEAGALSSEVFTEEKLIADCKLPYCTSLLSSMTAWQFLAPFPFSTLLPPSLPMALDSGRRCSKLQVAMFESLWFGDGSGEVKRHHLRFVTYIQQWHHILSTHSSVLCVFFV